MVKKTITYTDFDGNERTDDFYFNLTKAEITELDLAYEDGLDGLVQKIGQTKSVPAVLEIFKDLIRKSYGEKSLDGKRFFKNAEICDSFTATEAYSELLMECLSDAKAAAAFVNGIVPRVEAKSAAPSTIG